MLKRIFLNEEWNVAYRKRKIEKNILNDKETPFIVLKNTWRYWCADPFIVEEKNKVYVFFEAYDRLSRRGFIGYREIKEDRIGRIKIVIKEPFHLSYPFVYFNEKNWCLIPESSENNSVVIYQAKSFPGIWVKKKILMSDLNSLDTTLFFDQNKKAHLFLYVSKDTGKELQYLLQDNATFKLVSSIADDMDKKRPAGNIIQLQNTLYRPSQLGENTYGEAIIFNEIIEFSSENYSEKEYKRIFADDLKFDRKDKWVGMHTYSYTENYEVIDVKIYRINIIEGFTKAIHFFKRNLTKKLS